jgi:prophage tail gpP-like protein
VKIDADVVITGYVGRVMPRYDATSHIITVTGRDRAGDLVDCSAIYKTGGWHGATLLQIVTDLCAPFGIPVIAAADVGAPFREFSVQEGETAFDAIHRAAAMRGLLPISDQVGGIVLARAGSGRYQTMLQRPGNILAGAGDYSDDDRYSIYIVKGQRRGTDDDVGQPELLSSASGRVVDDGVTRYRPLIVVADEQGDKVSFERRAAWERNVRLGKSIRVNISVWGWREKGDKGDLWEPNRLVHIKDPWLWLDDDLLISGVSYSKSEGRGTICDLQLTHPAAFELLSESAQASARKAVSVEKP